MYFLFASAVVVLASEFSNLYTDSRATECIHNAITIMEYCAETDPQGKRLLFILQAFRDVVVDQRAKAAHESRHNSVVQPALPNGTGRVSPPGISSTILPLMVNGAPAEDASPNSTRHNSVGVIDPLDLSRVPTNPLGSEISEDLSCESMWDRLAANSSSMTDSVGITPGGRIGIVPTQALLPINMAIGEDMMGIYSVKSVAFGGGLHA